MGPVETQGINYDYTYPTHAEMDYFVSGFGFGRSDPYETPGRGPMFCVLQDRLFRVASQGSDHRLFSGSFAYFRAPPRARLS